MIFAEFFKGLFGITQAQIPSLPDGPAKLEVVPVDPEPLCTSTGFSAYSSIKTSLANLLPEPLASFSGMRLFQSQAIPMSTLNVGTSSIAFGDVNVGSSSSQNFNLKNDTECPINYTISYSSPFTVSPTSGRLNPKTSVNITVTFAPTEARYYSDYVNPSPSSGSVSVTGTGKKN